MRNKENSMKVLIAYYSSSGKTEKMAQYIAEGIRIAGHEAIMKKLEDLKAGDLVRVKESHSERENGRGLRGLLP
jgi:flavodoxin